ncbi:MAG: T9SS type A sorting domain-containing protein [Bacteroidales bacterium]|nr:T9SS type A sorting domain-containing protein [Bacteroidales bacterium]
MKWEYRFIFLLMSLVFPMIINAQHCLNFRYDKSGNRTEMFVGDCGFEFKEATRDIVTTEILEKNNSDDLLVYPNPNEGLFNVKIIEDNSAIGVAKYWIYDSLGILVEEGVLSNDHKIDIADNPSGVYLLRIVKGKCSYNCVVVKL